MKIKTKRYYVYYLARIVGFCIGILPLRVGLFLAGLAGKMVSRVFRTERETALANLRECFPEKSEAEIGQIVDKLFSNLCKNAVELVNIYKLNKGNLEKWATSEGFEKVERAFSKGKGILMLGSHFGNWEITGIYFAFRGYVCNSIARRIYFDRYHKFIENSRRSKGINLLYRGEVSPKTILRHLRNNEAMGVMADQDMDSVDGVFVDFFGKPTYTARAPVALALASGAPLIPCFLVREERRHRFIIEDPIEIEKKSNKEETIKFNTQKWTRVLESYIRKYPEHWVWLHKRWKTKPEELCGASQ